MESYDRRYSLLCVLLANQAVTEIEPFSRTDCWDGVSHHSYGDLTRSFAIELKPQIGDDFPSVLRQMKRNNASVLVVGEFNSSICSLEEVRSMFATSGKKIVTLGEIEAILRKGVRQPPV